MSASSGHALLQAAKDTVYPIWLKQVRTDDDASLELLFVVRTADRVTIYENQGGGTFAAVDRKSQTIGSGSSTLGKYLADWLFDPSMSMRRARTIAAYILKHTKTYDPSVGGDSQVLMIPSDVSVAPFFIDIATIQQLEQHLDSLIASVREILVRAGVVGVDFSDETAAARLGAFPTTGGCPSPARSVRSPTPR